MLKTKKIGLVGGISWVSTIDYYRFINEGINQKLGGLNYAECMIYSLNFGDIQALTWDNSYELLLHASQNLEKSGADVIVLCANTAHLFADKIQEQLSIPIIHIVSAMVNVLLEKQFKKVGLLGTIFTMEQDLYFSELKAQQIDCIVPEAKSTRNYIQKTLKEELGKGVFKVETKQKYLSIINELINDGAEAIILGCTEIPMLIKQEDIEIPIFDTTLIHAQAAVEFAVS